MGIYHNIAPVNDGHHYKVNYTTSEICPSCGIYTPDGQVCDNCLKKYGLYKPKISYDI